MRKAFIILAVAGEILTVVTAVLMFVPFALGLGGGMLVLFFWPYYVAPMVLAIALIAGALATEQRPRIAATLLFLAAAATVGTVCFIAVRSEQSVFALGAIPVGVTLIGSAVVCLAYSRSSSGPTPKPANSSSRLS